MYMFVQVNSFLHVILTKTQKMSRKMYLLGDIRTYTKMKCDASCADPGYFFIMYIFI